MPNETYPGVKRLSLYQDHFLKSQKPEIATRTLFPIVQSTSKLQDSIRTTLYHLMPAGGVAQIAGPALLKSAAFSRGSGLGGDVN